jgi:rod shape-determining protein MreB
MRTTYVPPLTPETAKDQSRRLGIPLPTAEPLKPAKGDTLLVGLDLGTNTSCLQAVPLGSTDLFLSEVLPTIVGYAKEGIVENLLPGNAKVLFGPLAIKNRMYLRMVPPLADGVVADMAAAHDFMRHLRQLINVAPGVEVRVVAGLPATADRTARDHLTEALGGFFDKALLIPEPFLAALGFRDESRLGDPTYLDPVRNSVFVDIGAGTTDVCLVQGYFPTADDQMSVPFAGDRVDALLQASIRQAYPDVDLSLFKVRELKETHSYVGKLDAPITVSVVIGGKARKLELAEILGDVCQQLLLKVLDCVKAIIGEASTDSVGELMQNIILTGGGSRIRNLAPELERLLNEEGYEKPKVLSVGENYKQHVAGGALVAGRQAKESQWIPLGER